MSRNCNDEKLARCSWGFHGLGLLVTAGVVLAALFLGIRPIEEQEARLLAKAAQLATALDIEAAVQAEHTLLAAKRQAADVKVQELLDRIPNVPRESDFLGQITTLASEVGLSIVDYRPGTATEKQGYKQMTLTLSSDGSYESVCSFLHKLNELPRLNRVTTLDIAPVNVQNQYQMMMTLTIFFAPDSQLPTAGGKRNHV